MTTRDVEQEINSVLYKWISRKDDLQPIEIGHRAGDIYRFIEIHVRNKDKICEIREKINAIMEIKEEFRQLEMKGHTDFCSIRQRLIPFSH